MKISFINNLFKARKRKILRGYLLLKKSNRLPILFIPGDTFANRFPDPVLQQVEDFYSPTVTQNDSFKAVSRYFDRITRPEQILTSLPQALQIMLDQADCGPATISISQDVQGEVFAYPEIFFQEQIHEIRRIYPDHNQIKRAADVVKNSKQPLIISQEPLTSKIL